jgi:hypothetical protein
MFFGRFREGLDDLLDYFKQTLAKMAANALASSIYIPIHTAIVGPSSAGAKAFGDMLGDAMSKAFKDYFVPAISWLGQVMMSLGPLGAVAAGGAGAVAGSMIGGTGATIGGAVGGIGGYYLGSTVLAKPVAAALATMFTGTAIPLAIAAPIVAAIGLALGTIIGGIFDKEEHRMRTQIAFGGTKSDEWLETYGDTLWTVRHPEEVGGETFVNQINLIFESIRENIGSFLELIGESTDRIDEAWDSAKARIDEGMDLEQVIELWAEDYIKFLTEGVINFEEFVKAGETFNEAVLRIIAAVEAFPKVLQSFEDYRRAIEEGNDEFLQFSLSMRDVTEQIDKLTDELEKATDPSDLVSFSMELSALIYQRYEMEKQFILDLIDAIEEGEKAIVSLKVSFGQFLISIQQKIDDLTGSFGVQGLIESLIPQFMGLYTGATSPEMKLELLGAAEGMIDAYLASEIAEIEAKYADKIAAEEEAIQAEQESLEAQLDVIEAWKSLLESVQDTIHDMLTGPESPEDVYARLEYARVELEKLKQEYLGATGEEKVELAGELHERLKEYLDLAGEAFQRPSNIYDELFNQVLADLQMIESDAEKFASQEQDVRQQIADNTASTAASVSAMNSEIEAANALAASYYEWIYGEGSQNYADMIQDQIDAVDKMKAELSSILGDESAEDYLKSIELAALLELAKIRDLLTAAWKKIFPEVEIPSTELPNIPAAGAGAYIKSPQLVLAGEKGPELIIPENKLKNRGNNITIAPNITIHAGEGASAEDIGREVARAIKDSVKYDGGVIRELDKRFARK